MNVQTAKVDGVKTVIIRGVMRTDKMFVIPLLILHGLSEVDAIGVFNDVIDGEDLKCVTDKGVKVICSRECD